VSATRTKQEVFPEFDLDVVNVSVPYPGASPEEVEEGIVLVVEEAVRALEGVAPKQRLYHQEPDQVKVPTAILSEYQGQYEIQGPMLFEIWLEKDTLKAKVTGKRDVHPLVPISSSEFNLPTLNATMLFERDAEAKVIELTYTKDGKSISIPKLNSNTSAGKVDLSEYTGEYYSDELSTFYRLILEDGELVAQHPRHSDIPLEVMDRDFLSGNTWTMKEIKVIRDKQQTVVGIKISSTRSRNLWFEKVE
jgi:hypothetical protein